MWGNILIGILLVIGGLSGRFVLRGTQSSAALVVFGILVALWGVYQAAKKTGNRKKALNNPVLQDPAVAAFYSCTLNEWGAGSLEYLDKSFRNGAMKLDYNGLVAALPPIPGSALDMFFGRYRPEPNEYLIGNGNDSKGKGWFVLTNFRLIQRDGKTNEFREIRLDRVQGYTARGSMTKVLAFVLKTGENILIEKVSIYPGEGYLMKIASHAAEASQGQITE